MAANMRPVQWLQWCFLLLRKLWNDRVRKQKGSKVCLLTEYGPLLKQMYSTSHHSFCFWLYKCLFFGAMELSNLSEDCLAREVAPDLFARIVNTSRGGLIDTRALIHGHFVRKKNEIARSLTLLLCHSPSILIRWWDLLGTTWSWGLKTGVIAGAAMDVVENEAPYFFRTELDGSLWNIHWMIFEQWEQFNQFNSSSLRTISPFPTSQSLPSPPPGNTHVLLFCSLRLLSILTARNFSNSCVTDDNIAVLLRMPNVILTPHLAFFTKETILRSWLLAVQTRQTHKKRKIWTDPKSSHNHYHYRNCGIWLQVMSFPVGQSLIFGRYTFKTGNTGSPFKGTYTMDQNGMVNKVWRYIYLILIIYYIYIRRYLFQTLFFEIMF